MAAAPAGAASAAKAKAPQLTITTVSNPGPSEVSGGQVLARISLPTKAKAANLTVLVGKTDETSHFAVQKDGILLGLVSDLKDGKNTVTATVGKATTSLVVTNHPITGPVFSGPQQQPFSCETTAYGLAPSVSPLCSAPMVVSYDYYTTAGAFAPLSDPASRPADLAKATVNGKKVPYIVRVETGTIDRAVYQTAALYDGSEPSPLRPDTSWNRALVHTFGGGCNAGFHQGNAAGRGRALARADPRTRSSRADPRTRSYGVRVGRNKVSCAMLASSVPASS